MHQICRYVIVHCPRDGRAVHMNDVVHLDGACLTARLPALPIEESAALPIPRQRRLGSRRIRYYRSRHERRTYPCFIWSACPKFSLTSCSAAVQPIMVRDIVLKGASESRGRQSAGRAREDRCLAPLA
jgi:hypothetical protein